MNRHGIEKSNVDLEELSGSIFEESKVSLGVALNYHEFKLTMIRRGVAIRVMVVRRGKATGTTVLTGTVETDDSKKKIKTNNSSVDCWSSSSNVDRQRSSSGDP